MWATRSTFRGSPRNRCGLPESRLSWRWKTAYPLSGGCGGFRNGLEATPDQATLRYDLSRSCSLTSECQAWSWRLDACQCPLEDSGTDPESLEPAPRVATKCENQRFAPVVAGRADGAFGYRPQVQAAGIILQRCHASCDNPPFATPTCHRRLRAVRCAPPPPGGRIQALERALHRTAFGSSACDAGAPASRPCSPGSEVEAQRSDGNQQRRWRCRHPSGCARGRPRSDGQWTTCPDPGPHEVDVIHHGTPRPSGWDVPGCRACSSAAGRSIVESAV